MVMARQTGRHAICRNVVGQARRVEKEVVYGLNTTSLPLVGRKGYVYDPPYHNLMQGGSSAFTGALCPNSFHIGHV